MAVDEPTTRAGLVDAEHERWTQLQELLRDMPAGRTEEPVVNDDGWSVRDVVWHLACWNDVVATQLEAIHAGTFDEGFDWETEENNARFLSSGHSIAYADALTSLRESRARVIRAMEELEEVTPRALELFSEPARNHVDDHLPELRHFLETDRR
jgi:hypothetical protein